MPPDEIDAATFYNSGRLGASRVTYNIHDLNEFVDSVMPANQSAPYFEGSTPENYWNDLSEDNFREIANILYLENAPNYQQHLNYIFDFGRSYPTWRNLWDNYRSAMVEIRNRVYNTISNMTVSQANNMGRILNRTLEHIIGLNPHYIELLSRWVYTLDLVYGDGSIAFPVVEAIYDYEVNVDPVEGDDAVSVTAEESGTWATLVNDSSMRALSEAITRTNTMVVGFTGSYTVAGMTEEEAALNTLGVCNLNDLANAHAYNKNPKVEFEKIKVSSEQEIWEGLQKNHAGMMETIQYILDDCTIDYKESNKTKRIDKMKQEMVPRIKGVLTCMDDRLDHYDKHYLNKWLWELINFAIDCNGPLPYRRLAPNIKQWNQKEEPRIKKLHTSLHIIPRLSE
jgi:hypothetical protein